MINEISLLRKDYTKYTDIDQEIFSIPELYLTSLPKFDSTKIRKCIIFLWENNQIPPKEKILGCAKSYQFFDFEKYLSLNEDGRKFMQLQVIHHGMLDIAADYGWNKAPIETAYENCLTSNLIFEKEIKKRKLSPNRKQYLSLWAYCDLNCFKITWAVSDKQGNSIKKGVLLTEQPSFIDMWYRVNFHWVNDDIFIVESNYKGLITEKWQIDLRK